MEQTVLGLTAHHLPAVLIVGLAIFFGTLGARIFQKLRFPQVVGYIVIGLLIGKSVFGLIDDETIGRMRSFNMFALGIIGFMIGGELKLEIFRKYGKQFLAILFAEGLAAFVLVAALVTVLGQLLGFDWPTSIALGLVLGAISSATAPAATVDVLWEYKTRGMLTRTVLAIVALDDGLALLIYGFASAAAGALTGTGESGLLATIREPLWEIIGAILLGLATGGLLILMLHWIKDEDKVLTFTIASVLLIIGLSVALKVESILAAMVLGATISNFLPRRSKETFKLIEKFAPPIFVLFFVLVGARLQLRHMPLWIVGMAAVYVLGRSVGKISGAYLGARWGGAPATVRKYLGLCLFSQAGVAVGLSILASHRFDVSIGGGMTLGDAIILVVTTSTFVVQLLGPACVKMAVRKAGEVGMNVTEDDLIGSYTVADVMDAAPTTIAPGTRLVDILKTFSETDSLYYPVVNGDGRLQGIITIDSIKSTFAHQGTAGWLLACDVMEDVLDRITPDTRLADAMRRMKRYHLDNICVIAGDDGTQLAGVLHHRSVTRKINAELLRRKTQADDAAVEPAFA